jgi:excisionase family DNA binding protein
MWQKQMISERKQPDDSMPAWLDLKALTGYACVSERTLREWIHRPENPLPAVRVGTKLLVRRTSFDQWLENHMLKSVDVGCMVNEILAGVAGPN